MAEGSMPFLDAVKGENPDLSSMISQWIPGVAEPREISDAVLWLASGESRRVTGHALAVDGGTTQY
jgi:NAD(P)-dependent dehydrogenase (short-subunit alcohol dehydrogenase family)